MGFSLLRSYCNLEGIWYCVTFASVPPKPKVTALLLQTQLSDTTAQKEYGRAIYACHKRRATKKEIRAIRQQRSALIERKKEQLKLPYRSL